MKRLTPNSLMPVMITAITSTLFLERYDSAYVVSMITGLTLFFYFAECVRRAACAIQVRNIHHYAIPRAAALLYAPSLAALAFVRLARTPRGLTELLAAIGTVALSMALLWALIWGISRLIRHTIANHRLFLPAANYGLDMLVFFTPIFYPLGAIHNEFLRTILSYNPLAVAIITTRASLIGNYAPVSPYATSAVTTLIILIICAGYFKKPNPHLK